MRPDGPLYEHKHKVMSFIVDGDSPTYMAPPKKMLLQTLDQTTLTFLLTSNYIH